MGIKVPYAEIYGGRSIGLSFDCSWDEENGLGIRLNQWLSGRAGVHRPGAGAAA